METNESTISVKSVSIKWGLILGIISIALFLTIAIAQLQGNSAIQWFGYIPAILLIFLAHKEFKEQGDGFMSYGQGLGIGTLIVAISSAISSVFAYVYIKFIDPTYMDIVKELQVEEMMNSGMSDAEIEQALEFSQGFMTPGFIMIMAFLVSVFFGFLISLVVSAITKNNNPALEV
ncbi:DUF4199 domain-containing protein [Fulvivirga lutea]|uniref:DUF4199 domain-containing protein n=1 Tax=Fulvivirga lutea TaxID=2810512 RepID=A0A974ZZY6_9BACT|nr:DUF4199 domain-containing protein [Fulvivirga lutea]QSE95907.1 DUF4199 domain-containing protein [Fulvivirga lutea]